MLLHVRSQPVFWGRRADGGRNAKAGTFSSDHYIDPLFWCVLSESISNRGPKCRYSPTTIVTTAAPVYPVSLFKDALAQYSTQVMSPSSKVT